MTAPDTAPDAALGRLAEFDVVPLVGIKDPATVDAIADGLVAGGLPVAEVALRGEHGVAAIARMAGRGDVFVGAGTVLSVEQAREAIDAGASFVVTPGLDLEVVRYVRDAGLPIVPGVLTPSEVQTARREGLRRLKLFPAGVFGGLSVLSAYADVFRDMKFMPSGGITQANLAEHLEHQAVFAASGSWITSSGDVEQIATVARAAAETGRAVRGSAA